MTGMALLSNCNDRYTKKTTITIKTKLLTKLAVEQMSSNISPSVGDSHAQGH